MRARAAVVGLVLVTVGVFVWQQVSAEAPLPPSILYGAIPARLTAAWEAWKAGDGLGMDIGSAAATLLTAVFLHGDPQHLINNLLFLWVFATLVARELGPVAMLGVFLVAGAAGNVFQASLSPLSLSPTIGASGAVCGLEGAYLFLAIRRELTWPYVWPMARPVPPSQLAAMAVIGLVLDLFFLRGGSRGIAYGAHVGGFVAGAALGFAATLWRPGAVGRRE